MADIDKLIQDLQSDDIEKRYDACKQLRGESSLPEEAIYALRKASKGPDPLISFAALRAFESHKSEIPSTSYEDKSRVPGEVMEKSKRTPLLKIQNVGLILLAALTAFSVVCVYFAYSIDMSGAGVENILAGLIILCMIGAGVSILAGIITTMYLHFWRNRFSRYVDVLLSIVFGLISILVGVIVGFIIDFLLVSFRY